MRAVSVAPLLIAFGCSPTVPAALEVAPVVAPPPPYRSAAGGSATASASAATSAGPCAPPAPDGYDEQRTRITLRGAREGRGVRVQAEGATLLLDRAAVEAQADCLREPDVLAYLAAHPESPIRITTRLLPSNGFAQVIAALLDRGQAEVRDDAAPVAVESLVRDGWLWIGCGGRCRQSGRAYRLLAPGAEIFRTTDRFDDAAR